MSPSFIGTSSFLNVTPGGSVGDGIDVGEHADLAPAPDGHVDHEPDEQPGRAGVAGAGMGDQREHPHRERQRGPDQGRQRHEDAANHHLGLGPERALEIRLLAAEPDHGELRRREGEQHPERVGAGEEGGVVLAEDPGDDRRSRSRPHRWRRAPRGRRASAARAGRTPAAASRARPSSGRAACIP